MTRLRCGHPESLCLSFPESKRDSSSYHISELQSNHLKIPAITPDSISLTIFYQSVSMEWQEEFKRHTRCSSSSPRADMNCFWKLEGGLVSPSVGQEAVLLLSWVPMEPGTALISKRTWTPLQIGSHTKSLPTKTTGHFF